MQFEATTPTFEDKVLQRAVAMVLEAVYEQSFLDCSYGFRPGRSAHQALRVVQNQTVKMAGKWRQPTGKTVGFFQSCAFRLNPDRD
jgi:hypothetical protein